MFLIELTFTDLNKITPELTQVHRDYLAKEYETNQLLFGGRKEPRTGGLLISDHKDETRVRALMDSDPFVESGVAKYKITEFIPVMASDEYRHLLA